MSVYKAGSGAQYNDEKAQLLGQVLESLGTDFQPVDIVNAARPKRSPIHSLFEWDNTVAAEKYRVFQARNHTNRLEIVITSDGDEQKTKAFHSIVITESDDTTKRAYSQMATIMDNKDLRKQVVANALSELNRWKSKYAEYKQIFSGVFQSIEKANQRK